MLLLAQFLLQPGAQLPRAARPAVDIRLPLSGGGLHRAQPLLLRPEVRFLLHEDELALLQRPFVRLNGGKTLGDVGVEGREEVLRLPELDLRALPCTRLLRELAPEVGSPVRLALLGFDVLDYRDGPLLHVPDLLFELAADLDLLLELLVEARGLLDVPHGVERPLLEGLEFGGDRPFHRAELRAEALEFDVPFAEVAVPVFENPGRSHPADLLGGSDLRHVLPQPVAEGAVLPREPPLEGVVRLGGLVRLL